LGAVDYVRCLEEALIRTCADFGVSTQRVPKLTGVWAQEAKVAAIGVHISRGISSHGFALNVQTDLNDFELIVPCGIATKQVTSLSKESGTLVALDTVAHSVARNFGRVFNSQILWVESLEALLGHSVGVPMKVPEPMRKIHHEDTFWV
jgi:lipoyl(octanoyl) transferase